MSSPPSHPKSLLFPSANVGHVEYSFGRSYTNILGRGRRRAHSAPEGSLPPPPAPPSAPPTPSAPPAAAPPAPGGGGGASAAAAAAGSAPPMRPGPSPASSAGLPSPSRVTLQSRPQKPLSHTHVPRTQRPWPRHWLKHHPSGPRPRPQSYPAWLRKHTHLQFRSLHSYKVDAEKAAHARRL